MKLSLEEVTLVCVDTRNIDLALNSMNHSLANTKFFESILFTSKPLCSTKHIEAAKNLGIKLNFIPEIESTSEYSSFILAKLGDYIFSQYCLITQWDSWIINIQSWDKKFLKYDYIGAIWPHYSSNIVGNGGFSLRSKTLLKATKEFIAENPNYSYPLVEDDFICREQRSSFETKYNIKFPSKDIANKFSVELNKIPLRSFGFHGLMNFNLVIKNDSNLIKIVYKLDNDCFIGRGTYDLTKSLLRENRKNVAKILIKKRISIIGLSSKNLKLIIFYLFS
jgi:hypothetical protein